MGAARYISLSEAEDKQLQKLENNPRLNEKVRLRAKVLRFSHRPMGVEEIAADTGRHSTSVLRDFQRWEEHGVAGLADGVGRGQRSPLGEKHKRFLAEKLSEDRGWTATQVADEVTKTFKLKVNRETMRVCLHSMGYSWQRQRYVPVKAPDAKLLAVKQDELDTLKKGPSKARLS